ncbi:PREDICTED: LOW QUALITY PROTEIN: erythroblast NAD(P)(+)--arginine ADP-ribosyltransferase-like, partial [Apaloderma vittatum]|uniref:LOW QUALITY PROTEIN: erythroblast NAD(P)(+)--arginine ADP-ribosyltransferase-like n=1 Tax=Apaloderma vittatum TaxID=57397 RepID=UPI000521A68F
MDLLVLGLVLLAENLVTGSPSHRRDLNPIKVVALDMAKNSFDDQYRGCSHMMEEELEELNRTEFTNNSIYARAWTLATTEAEWRNRRGRIPRTLRPEQAIALMAYTLQNPLHGEFNAAVRQAGQSHEEYLGAFHFKSLHFLLSEALRALRDGQPQRCHHHFTSTSLRNESIVSFGQDTFFSVVTCYGVSIRDFSYFPDEEEVLIPPFEVFNVTNVTQHSNSALISLHSKAANSTYNCVFVKGDISAGQSLPVALDMAPNSFDDQYKGCSHEMQEELEQLNCTEFANNSVYARAWTFATKEWQKRQNHIPQTL